jgi:uncharacterized membrane protein
LIASVVARPGPKDLNELLAAIEAKLSAEDARAFDQAIRPNTAEYIEALERVLQARRRVDDVLAAEPYSAASLQAAIDAWREDWQTFVLGFSHSFVHALTEISPAGRRQLARVGQPTMPIVPPARER